MTKRKKTRSKASPSQTTTSTIEAVWCNCGEFPAKMCEIWPACVDINGPTWGSEERFQKYRRKREDDKGS